MINNMFLLYISDEYRLLGDRDRKEIFDDICSRESELNLVNLYHTRLRNQMDVLLIFKFMKKIF